MSSITKDAYEGDIVSRLRNWRGLHLAHGGTLFEEAADEIERLRLSAKGDFTEPENAAREDISVRKTGGDFGQPSPASAGSHNTHMATARLSAANTWLQDEIRRLRLTAEEREAVGRAADWLYRWQETHGYHSSENGDLATLRSLLERTR